MCSVGSQEQGLPGAQLTPAVLGTPGEETGELSIALQEENL